MEKKRGKEHPNPALPNETVVLNEIRSSPLPGRTTGRKAGKGSNIQIRKVAANKAEKQVHDYQNQRDLNGDRVSNPRMTRRSLPERASQTRNRSLRNHVWALHAICDS